MLKVEQSSLVISFPEIDSETVARVSCRSVENPDTRLELVPHPKEGFLLASRGRIMLHLQPWDQEPERRYPFAALISVGGINALTGRYADDRLTRPQNYFVSPPQGGVDAYVAQGQLHPMVAWGDPAEDRTPMLIRMLPAKVDLITETRKRSRMVGSDHTRWGCHFALPNAGEPRCEPVYEDICSLSDWAQDREERLTIWLHPG